MSRANRRRPARRLPDGFPAPPHRLHTVISGNAQLNEDDYFTMGARFARSIATLLEDAGHPLREGARILDFGCGVGRIIRHLRGAGILHGVDINPRLVSWCSANLPFASFRSCHPEPPLPFADGAFDLAIAFSVFTHLAADQQSRWLAELRRVVGRHGVMIITFHGDTFAHTLDPVSAARFAAGEMVVLNPQDAGHPETYAGCSTYHPPSFVRDILAPFHNLEVLGVLNGEVLDERRGISAQDAYLFAPAAVPVHREPVLLAQPNPPSAASGFATATIAWATGSDRPGHVYVAEPGRPSKRFSGGRPQGFAQAPWIGPGNDYTFSLQVDGTGASARRVTVSAR